jgi:hypothetical protein
MRMIGFSQLVGFSLLPATATAPLSIFPSSPIDVTRVPPLIISRRRPQPVPGRCFSLVRAIEPQALLHDLDARSGTGQRNGLPRAIVGHQMNGLPPEFVQIF